MNMMKGGIMYEQKEIVLLPFPYSDLTGSKMRPALIISNDKLNSTRDRICCLITSNPSNNGILIKKEDFESGKLPFKSWIKPQRIFSIDEKIIRKKLCKVSNPFYEKIIYELNSYIEHK